MGESGPDAHPVDQKVSQINQDQGDFEIEEDQEVDGLFVDEIQSERRRNEQEVSRQETYCEINEPEVHESLASPSPRREESPNMVPSGEPPRPAF
jgi:hypothetical protein